MSIWDSLYCTQRIGGPKSATQRQDARSQYQIDIDRIIFSPSFRRLQNKTQVFPLPGSALVHNRLTHSLEVSSVGRSLGTLIGDFINQEYDLSTQSQYFYRHEMSNVVSAACLCHDIGNPSFGHSGEKAISNYFIQNETNLRSYFSDQEWNDFINFEGNANALRLLTQQQNGKAEGAFRLTATTLASIAKYPCESIAMDKALNVAHRKKYGFFQSEKETFKEIASLTGLTKESDFPLSYKRHPFAYLVECADDICYRIMDIEDAHKLRIISFVQCAELMLELINSLNPQKEQSLAKISRFITDKNEQIAFLRANAIGALIHAVVGIFKEESGDIATGNLDLSILDILGERHQIWEEIGRFSFENIYLNEKVVEIEVAGFNVMYVLLEHFVPVVIPEYQSTKNKMIEKLLPSQYLPQESDSMYLKVMRIIDFVSGMTDLYATDLYRRIQGIEIRRI